MHVVRLYMDSVSRQESSLRLHADYTGGVLKEEFTKSYDSKMFSVKTKTQSRRFQISRICVSTVPKDPVAFAAVTGRGHATFPFP